MRRAILVLLAGCGRIDFAPIDATSDGLADGVPDVGEANLNRVFVTSIEYPFDVDLAEADVICTQHATAFGVTGTFVAWLSSSTTDARTRFGSARGFVRVDGLPFVDTIDDLTAGRILNPISMTELGTISTVNSVRTGSTPDGVQFGGTCADWTDTAAGGSVKTGNPRSTSTSWTDNGSMSCTLKAPLYCLQVDHETPLVITAPTPSRRAFLSRTAFAPGTGLANADAACMADATMFGHAGTYRALLPTTTQSAASRFMNDGGTWVRLDGAPLATDAASTLGGAWKTSLNLDAGRTYVGPNAIITGGPPGAPGTAGTTCDSWSAPNGFVRTAAANASEPFSSTTDIGCSTARPVYCLQE